MRRLESTPELNVTYHPLDDSLTLNVNYGHPEEPQVIFLSPAAAIWLVKAIIAELPCGDTLVIPELEEPQE